MKKFVEILIMAYKIIISNEAFNDTNDAYIYYEKKKAGLGNRFLDELFSFYEKLQNHPTYYSFTSKEKTTRFIALKKFPYSIIYEVAENELYIFAIHHFKQDPDHFLKRS